MAIFPHKLASWIFPAIRRKWRKRYVLLLEVLIAFTLVVLCALPLVRGQVALAQLELETLRELQLERAANSAYTEVCREWLTHELGWKTLRGSKAVSLSLPVASILLPKGRQQSYCCSCELSVGDVYEKSDRAWFRLLNVVITLAPEASPQQQTCYYYQLLILRCTEGREQPYDKIY